jgi:uncharacterized membrane protein YdbT with pleckstrin-like domain
MNEISEAPKDSSLFIASSTAADEVYYSGRPSQACNFPFFSGCAVGIFLSILATIFVSVQWDVTPLIGLLPVFVLGVAIANRVINTHAIEILIDSARVTWKTGVVSRTVASVEIFRIQNVTMSQSAADAMFGIGHLYIETIDPTHPLVHLFGIAEPEKMREWLTEYAQTCRKEKQFREFSLH